MKQVLRKGFKDIVVDEVPDPVPEAHHVLIQPAFSLISSGTEAASIHKDGVLKEVVDNPSHLRKIWEVMKSSGPLPTTREVMAKFGEYASMGYSGAGVVVSAHSSVTDLKAGDRVAYGGQGTGHGELVVTGRNLVARVPDDVPFEEACFATLGSIALTAVRTSGVGVGDIVAVIGMGIVGQLVAQLVRAQGGVVVAIDLQRERIELARQLGAEYGVAVESGVDEAVGAATGGRGADCVIVAAAAKTSAPCTQALRICRDRGRIVVVGAVDMHFPWEEMYLKEIQLFMSRAYGPGSYDPAYEKQGRDYPIAYVRWTENRNMEEFLRLVMTGRVRVAPLISHRYALDQAPSAYEAIMDPAVRTMAVLLEYPRTAPELPQTHKVATPFMAPAKAEFGVAVAGTGNISRWAHLPALKRIPGVSLRAIYSASGMRGKSQALRFRAAYCCSDFEEVLKDQDIDVVLIASRNQYHAAQALAALRAGKHVMVEKPMALTEEECRSLNAAVAESGRQLSVGFNRRFAPFYRAQKAALAQRSGPAVLNARVNSPGISGSYWMADPAIGGAILGEACHFTDLFYWLLNSEPVEVSAYCLPVGKGEPVGQNNLAASFLFADGSIANLTYCTVGSRSSAGERVEAFAPGMGVFTEDFKRLSVRRRLRQNSSRLFAAKGYEAQLESFFQALREGRPPETTVRDGIRATVACIRMLEAAQLRQPRPIDWETAGA